MSGHLLKLFSSTWVSISQRVYKTHQWFHLNAGTIWIQPRYASWSIVLKVTKGHKNMRPILEIYCKNAHDLNLFLWKNEKETKMLYNKEHFFVLFFVLFVIILKRKKRKEIIKSIIFKVDKGWYELLAALLLIQLLI